MSIILFIFEIIAVVAIIVMVNVKAASYGKADPIVKKNVAQDLALMVDVLVSFPGDVLVEYPQDVSKYSFLISSIKSGVFTMRKVVVFKKDESLHLKSEAAFTLPDNFDASGDVEQKARVCLKKTANKIFLEACP